MSAIFDALPGLEAPVGSISKSLGEMWSDTAAKGGDAPASEDAKATQVNFVLHLGFATKPEDAARQFQTAVSFSRRDPCRVVVLCPLPDDSGETEMRAKVYGECTLGKAKGDTRCCEFVMLSYPRCTRKYLESQVSVCLSTDLPLYYWAHRFSTSARLAEYHYLLTRARRILIDTAIAPADVLSFPWPRPEAFRDLAFARLLPLRQLIGQFLSRYPTGVLADGLRNVVVRHGSGHPAEARVLLNWARERITACGAGGAGFACEADAGTAAEAITLAFAYGNGRSFSVLADFAQGRADFAADFGTGRTLLTTPVSLLAPESALSESMFF